MMKIKRYAVWLFAIMVIACTVKPMRPDWVEGRSHDYPDRDYLTASGSGDKPEDANNRALANLARIFEVEVEDSSTDQSRAEVQHDGKRTDMHASQLAVRYVNAYTHKLLEGARLVESWYDAQSKYYHALALISRRQLATRLKMEIASADRGTEHLLRESEHTDDSLSGLRYLYAAYRLQHDRESFQRDLQIVDKSGKGVQPRWTSDELDRMLQKKLKQFNISVMITPDSEDSAYDKENSWHATLLAALGNAEVATAQSPADYELQFGLEREDLGYREGWYWVRGVIELRLLKNAVQEVRGARRWPVKVAGQTHAQAEIRLRSEVLKILNQQIKIFLLTNDS